MNIFDEVHLFAKDFINFESFRTSSRKKKIREAYKELTGEDLKVSCSTCFIEALLKITNSTTMTTKGYELKNGVLLQAFGDASKTVTNDTLTDEIAEWYLENQPEKVIYFSKLPTIVPIPVKVNAPANVTIIPPVKKEVDVAEALIKNATEPVKEESKVEEEVEKPIKKVVRSKTKK
jgi:hypothetical protein